MHDHDVALALTHRKAGQTRGGVVKGWPQHKHVVPGNVGIVREGQDVHARGRHRNPGGIGLLRKDRPKDDLRALSHSLLRLRGSLGRRSGGVVNAQINLHVLQIAHRQPRGVLKALGQNLVAELTRATRHQQGDLNGPAARATRRRQTASRDTGRKHGSGGNKGKMAQRLAGPTQNRQHLTIPHSKRLVHEGGS